MKYLLIVISIFLISTDSEAKRRAIFGDVLLTDIEPKSDFFWQRTNRTPPEYPMEMARASLAGCAILSFNISDSGTTENVQVIKSVPNKDLGKHSRYMVKKWRWDAANNDSNPSSEKRTLRMDYCLGEESAEKSLQLCKQQTQLACG